MSAGAMHPYKTAPERAFWSRSVSVNFDPRKLIDAREPLIRRGDKVVSAGSCFASNLVPYLEKSGLHYFRTEAMHPAFAHAATDNFGYSKFSAAYGNIYTVRQLLQLLRRALDQFHPVENHWDKDGDIVDPFRPGLRYRARTTGEFTALTRQHLARTKLAFTAANVFVLTLGLTEAWISSSDGAVFPACPGTIAGQFDADRHLFHNFTASEVSADLNSFITELRAINKTCRFIITVSPVPLVATAGTEHVLCASTYSKSVLRVAAQEAVMQHADVTYFPSYEIVTGPQAPDSYFESDRRNVTNEAVEAVMSTLLSHCETISTQAALVPRAMESGALVAGALSNLISEAECEEVMMGR
jgi:GSCFA family